MAIPCGYKKVDSVLSEIPKILEDYELSEPQSIQFGKQLGMSHKGQKIGVLRIYSSKKKGTSIDPSGILDEEHKKLVEEKIRLKLKTAKEGQIKLPQSFGLRNDKQIDEIKNIISSNYRDRVKFSKQQNMIYAAKINGFNIFQYNNGKLVINGKPNSISDEIIKNIRQVIQSNVISSFIKMNSEKFSDKDFKKLFEQIKQVKIAYPLNQNLFDYLFPNDQIELGDGLKILEVVKKDNIKLDNYICLVRNTAISFEGFLIKLFMDLGIINEATFVLNKSASQVGSILNTTGKTKSEFEEKFGHLYLRTKPHLSTKLDSLWKECRNSYLHSDFVSAPLLKDLSLAEAKISEIITTMEDLYELFQHKLSYESSADIDKISCIGIDESGKGDYFGSLVIASVFVDAKNVSKLIESGVMDSKEISDKKIFELEKIIKETCAHNVVRIGPNKYNQLYQELSNLNKILAWGHSRTLENILQIVSCNIAISDQFGDPSLVKNALMSLGKTIKLITTPKAETNISVAAASILARAEFLRHLEKLSNSVGIKLPKGSSNYKIPEISREIIKRYNREKLKDLAKLHFRITKEVVASLERNQKQDATTQTL